MLKDKQKKILEAVAQNPNIRLKELADVIGITAVSGVHAHIKKLIQGNYLIRQGHKLILTGRDFNEFTAIPFYGYAQCGDTDVFAEENVQDYIKMETRLLPIPTKDLFFIRAKGDSMEPTIADGELLLFRRLPTGTLPPANTIVFCRKDNGLKIKRLVQQNTEKGPVYKLVSDNKEKYESFNAEEDTNVYGVMVRIL